MSNLKAPLIPFEHTPEAYATGLVHVPADGVPILFTATTVAPVYVSELQPRVRPCCSRLCTVAWLIPVAAAIVSAVCFPLLRYHGVPPFTSWIDGQVYLPIPLLVIWLFTWRFFDDLLLWCKCCRDDMPLETLTEYARHLLFVYPSQSAQTTDLEAARTVIRLANEELDWITANQEETRAIYVARQRNLEQKVFELTKYMK